MNFEMKNIERQMLMYKYELITMYSFDLFFITFCNKQEAVFNYGNKNEDPMSDVNFYLKKV